MLSGESQQGRLLRPFKPQGGIVGHGSPQLGPVRARHILERGRQFLIELPCERPEVACDLRGVAQGGFRRAEPSVARAMIAALSSICCTSAFCSGLSPDAAARTMASSLGVAKSRRTSISTVGISLPRQIS